MQENGRYRNDARKWQIQELCLEFFTLVTITALVLSCGLFWNYFITLLMGQDQES